MQVSRSFFDPSLLERHGAAFIREDKIDEALRQLVHRRDEIVDRLDGVLFASHDRRLAFEALLAEPDLHAAMASVDPDVASLLAGLGSTTASEKQAAELLLLHIDVERTCYRLGLSQVTHSSPFDSGRPLPRPSTPIGA